MAILQQRPGAKEKSNDIILIVGAAGGVGSILVQLAKVLTGAIIIGTASRESSKSWVEKLGADYIIDHTKPLKALLETNG